MPEKLQEKIESVIQWHIMGYIAKKCDFATQVPTFSDNQINTQNKTH